MLETEQNIKIRIEAVILTIISHTFLHQKDGFPHQTKTAHAMLISTFPTGESLGLWGSYRTRWWRATGHTGSEVEFALSDRRSWEMDI